MESNRSGSGMLKAIIITALPVEYQAVRAHVSNVQEKKHPLGTIYESGSFNALGKTWEVSIVQTFAGNVNAAFEAERAMNYFKPKYVIFVGVITRYSFS